MLDFALLRNPWNWITVGAMVAVVAVAGFVIYSRMTSTTASLNDGESNLASET